MASSFGSSIPFALFLFLLLASSARAQLSSNFYARTCPNVRGLITSQISREVAASPILAAKLLRLFFHDCFILGCDASILLDDTPTFTGEKSAGPNRRLGGLEVIDSIKENVEAQCPGVVSCADIVAIATRAATEQVGGPSWELKLGRRDSLTASFSAASSGQLPGGGSVLSNLVTRFADKGFTANEMTTLSGAHSVGEARCATYRGHLSDANIDPAFAASLAENCPIAGGNNDFLAPLDPTPVVFDNSYYKNLVINKGLLRSDQELFNGGSEDALVLRYSNNQAAFFADFAAAMTKLSELGVLTGADGEIRTNCRVIN